MNNFCCSGIEMIVQMMVHAEMVITVSVSSCVACFIKVISHVSPDEPTLIHKAFAVLL